jgi:hypothetical protein
MISTEFVISVSEPVNIVFEPAGAASIARNTLSSTLSGLVLYILLLSCHVFVPCSRIRCGAGVVAVSQIPSYLFVALYSNAVMVAVLSDGVNT